MITLTDRRSGASAVLLDPFFVAETGVADRHNVAVREEVLLDPPRVDINTVLASPVNDPSGVLLRDYDSVTPADPVSPELDVIVIRAPNREAILEQRKPDLLVVDGADQHTGRHRANG